MSQYGIELYARLEAETGLATGWKQCGSVNVAQTDGSHEGAAQAARAGAQLRRRVRGDRRRVAPASCSRRCAPTTSPARVWIPGDGKANPADLTMSLAKGARSSGVRIVEGVEVVAVRSAHGRACRASPASRSHGGEDAEIACEIVVNCAGQWARQFGALAGVNVPLWSAEHFYIVTERDRRRRTRCCRCCATPTASSTTRKKSAAC